MTTSMSSVPGLRPLTPAAVKGMLGDDAELALVDVREELIFSQNHLLWARSVPVRTENLNPDVMVMKPAKDWV
jgi:hypothetical protein